MKKLAAFLVLAAMLAAIGVARGGHELPIYPSYYPQEIRIMPLDPASAAGALESGDIHAYLGGTPHFAGPPPAFLDAVESLGAYVVVDVNPASPKAADPAAACALAKAVVGAFAKGGDGFVFQPYPVTPHHGDYLYHADRAAAAKERFSEAAADAAAASAAGLRVKAEGTLAKRLVPPGWQADGAEWDAAVSEVDAAALLTASTVVLDGWLGPPWAKKGWYQAYRLLAASLGDGAAREVETRIRSLEAREYRGTAARVELEREIVAALVGGCARVVAGYTVKREFFNAEYSAGIENIAYDSIAGLDSPLFIRTVKLKDFPWNGWLRLGIATPPAAAWNPFGGFTDEAGRLIWSAVGDPALLPEPDGAGWMLNRAADVRSESAR